MSHKTFISYKYSEARELRDKIINSLGDATYYKGETSYSPDLTDESTEHIKEELKNMMYDTSVTVVILSPNMTDSKWIDWELEYCLKNIVRKNRTSCTNGIVGVIQKVDGDYSWFKTISSNYHGATTVSYKMNKIFDIIANNHFNSNPPNWHCNECRTYDSLYCSYISFIEEDEFLSNTDKYIDNAYDKSQNNGVGYNLFRKR